MTPEDVLDLQVKEFNKGNISFLMTLYENGACFASKPGQTEKDLKKHTSKFTKFHRCEKQVRSQSKKSASG